jgi:hypothetical protein
MKDSLLSSTEYIIWSVTNPVIYYDNVREKIRSFGLLPNGWDFGVGRAASQKVIEIALSLREQGSAKNLKTNAFPGTGGEIYVAFYKNEDTVEIRINLDLSFNITLERGFGANFEELEYIEGVSFNEVLSYLQRFSSSERLWRSSGHYIVINMMKTEAALLVTPSKTTPMAEFPLLKSSVFESLPGICAAT